MVPMAPRYDAFLLVSFGGPEGPDDVMPFLRNVVRGRDVPEERLQRVASNYDHFGGVSPLNGQCRALITALREELAQNGHRMPVYWGNRNWKPMLVDTLREMAADGVRNALAFVPSAYSSRSGCRQYLDDIARELFQRVEHRNEANARVDETTISRPADDQQYAQG